MHSQKSEGKRFNASPDILMIIFLSLLTIELLITSLKCIMIHYSLILLFFSPLEVINILVTELLKELALGK